MQSSCASCRHSCLKSRCAPGVPACWALTAHGARRGHTWSWMLMIPGTPGPPWAHSGRKAAQRVLCRLRQARAAGGDFRGDSPDERPPPDGDLTRGQIPLGQAGVGGKASIQDSCPHQSSNPFFNCRLLISEGGLCHAPSGRQPSNSAQHTLRSLTFTRPGPRLPWVLPSQCWGAGGSLACFPPSSPCVDSPVPHPLTAGRREAASASAPLANLGLSARHTPGPRALLSEEQSSAPERCL